MLTKIDYEAPPTVGRFMRDQSFFRIILGPVGSGKTTGTIFELFRRACEQRRSPDGIRYTRFAIVRQTLKQLVDTVLKDVKQWLGGVGEWHEQKKTFTIRVGDIVSEWLFIPLEDADDQRRLLSMQLTGAWMSEAIEMDVNLVPAILGRCGRYPNATMGGCTWFGAIADTNFPSQGSPWHVALEHQLEENWAVFKQPGGMEEHAENLEWLLQTPELLKLPPSDPRRREQGRTYYQVLLGSNNKDWVDRYVHAKYGMDPSGSAVYRTSFRYEAHVVDELTPVYGHNLIIAQDFGRNPWSLIGQVDHRDRLLILEEVPGTDTGLAVHIKDNLRPAILQDRYFTHSYFVVGDPSGIAKESITEDNPLAYLKQQGFQAYPSPSNGLEARLTASERWLIKQYGDGPAVLIDRSRCPTLVEALSGRYRFGKRKNGQTNVVPEKSHPHSDVADCFQYMCQVAGSGRGAYIANHVARQQVASLNNPMVRSRGRVRSGGWAR